MTEPAAPRIVVTENGPYLVSGGLPVSEQALAVDAEGSTWDFEDLGPVATSERYALCRCGHSDHKPFCDGTHAHIGFRAHDSLSPPAGPGS